MTTAIIPTPRSVADMTDGVIIATVDIAVPPERVFRALTEPGEVMQWWGSVDTYLTEEFSVDLRVGGRWRARGRSTDGRPYAVEGEFLEIAAPHRIVQTWIPDWAPGLTTTLTYRLEAIAGGTRVTVHHEGFADHRDACEGHTRGWELVLGWLRRHLASDERGFASRFLNPLRLAAIVLALFFLGHTMGALIFIPSFGAEADAVRSAMQSVHFRCQTSDCTWFGFYLGFGWIVSVFFVLSAAIAWYLGGLRQSEQRPLAPLIWILVAGHAVNTFLAWQYFFVAPRVFAVLVTTLLGYQCVVELRRRQR